MASFEHEVVGTATARLRAYAPLVALVGTRISYQPLANQPYPYVAVDETSSRRRDGSDLRASEVDLTIHVWTVGGNALQDARAISEAVEIALHDFDLPMPTKDLITLDHLSTRVFYDRDGITGHGVVSFTAHVQTNQ
jgi:hypothetical protein